MDGSLTVPLSMLLGADGDWSPATPGDLQVPHPSNRILLNQKISFKGRLQCDALPNWNSAKCDCTNWLPQVLERARGSSTERCSTMQEVNKSGTLKREWACKPRTDNQIHDGTDQKGCDLFIDDLFEEAQKFGAVCTQQSQVKNRVDTTIKLWKNGFTVNDGELRSYTDVANQRFLDSIKKGQLPLELQKICDKEEVDIKVDDKKNEVYALRKPLFHPFSGQGYRLGSATPRIISKVKRDVEEIEKRKTTVVLNHSEPITSIQIWLADGTRIVQNFNISHSGEQG
ncbi:UBX domain-containing protein 2A isoform X2 [Zootoca vivipara]|uniref:UBX domain-containing protein 2A isoform X2 n=1 Tax=Zootoca vivipara TaxID=8524 RepID=UPI00293BDA90|nr:UBX domain-containing protein 2A isoform X2 [Zootoca vivipara]